MSTHRNYCERCASAHESIDCPAVAQHTPGQVTEADVQAGREHIADVHNTEQMLSACGQLRREVVMEMAARGWVPDFYAKATGEQA